MEIRLGRSAAFLSLLVLTALAGCDSLAPRAAAVLPTRLPPTAGPSPTALLLPTPAVFPSPTVTEVLAPTSTATLTSTLEPTSTPTSIAASSSPGVTLVPILTPFSGSLSYGEPVQGTISNEAPAYRFTFRGQAGDVVTLSLSRQSGDLDAYLALEDPRGLELAANDDARNAASPTDARIEHLRLPVSGVYTVVATRFQREQGTSGGAFELSLERSESIIVPETRLPIAYGEVRGGVIGSGTPRVEYVFSGRGGDVITVGLRRLEPGDNLDPYLILLDMTGRQLAFNDDAPEPGDPQSTNARIDGFILPADGEYRIVATRFLEVDGSTQGAYELHLTREGQ
jgi:hypothetical protein